MYSTLELVKLNNLYSNSNKKRAINTLNNKQNSAKGLSTIVEENNTESTSINSDEISRKIQASNIGLDTGALSRNGFRMNDSESDKQDDSCNNPIIIKNNNNNNEQYDQSGRLCCSSRSRIARGASKSLKSSSRSILLCSVLIQLLCATVLVLIALGSGFLSSSTSDSFVEANVLMRVCDTREIKTVTSRVCMLYKRTKNSDVRLDKEGNLRITRSPESDTDTNGKGDYSPAKLATECCKIGCPPHYFAYNC